MTRSCSGKLVAIVEHLLSDRLGDWRVIIIASQERADWEMKIFGPNAFERSYTLEAAAGQHDPRAIAALVSRMLPEKARR